MNDSRDDTAAWWHRAPWNWLRRGAAAVLIVGLSVVVVLSYLPGALIASCREELASDGNVVAVCGPIGAADIVLVGLVLTVAGLFVWPELSELGVGGLFTLKRRVDQTQRQQEETADTVRSLTLAQEIPDLGATRTKLKEQLEHWSRLPDDVRVVPTGKSRPAAAPDGARVISEQRADIEDHLLRLAHEIDDYLKVVSHEAPMRLLTHPARSRRLRGVDLDDYLAGLRQWARDYEGSLRDWAVVRNMVVHYPERLSDEEVRQAVAVGEGLVAALGNYLPPSALRNNQTAL